MANREKYEKYLDYLRNERELSDGTIVEHLTSAIYALKMLHAKYVYDFMFLLTLL
jgi:hypothetical protein